MNGGRIPLLILAAGGTGGHIFPAQALAEEMLGRGWQVTLGLTGEACGLSAVSRPKPASARCRQRRFRRAAQSTGCLLRQRFCVGLLRPI